MNDARGHVGDNRPDGPRREAASAVGEKLQRQQLGFPSNVVSFSHYGPLALGLELGAS